MGINVSKNIKELIISIYKMVSMALVFGVFFVCFGFEYSSLMRLSRTLAVTMISCSISFIMFSKIYGNLQIGVYKSREVIYSTSLAVFFTDIITYLSLMVMLTNPNNVWANASFKLEHLNILLSVVVVQVLIIGIVSFLGNYLFFELYAPQNTLIIYDKNYPHDKGIATYISQYKKQYFLMKPIEIRDKNLNSSISQADYIIFSEMSPDIRKNLTEVCYSLDIDFAFSPSIPDIVEMSGIHATYNDKPVIEVRNGSMSFNQRFVKRTLDIGFSFLGIILTFPLWIVFMVAIKLDDQGPVFFRQARKTINGKEFKVYKFRSMKVDASITPAVKDDDRITRFGRVLRKTRLDELPQLINILVGDMSVVGPRPEMLSNIEIYEEEMPEFKYRLKVKAGLTGIAQIEGKYNTSPKDKLILDLLYIENYSIWLDLKLLFKTVIIFFKKDSTEGFTE